MAVNFRPEPCGLCVTLYAWIYFVTTLVILKYYVLKWGNFIWKPSCGPIGASFHSFNASIEGKFNLNLKYRSTFYMVIMSWKSLRVNLPQMNILSTAVGRAINQSQVG